MPPQLKTVTITGHSDDLIEVDGDIIEEFEAYDCSRFLYFNDGTIVMVGCDQEDDTGWYIEVVKRGKGLRGAPDAQQTERDLGSIPRVTLTGRFTGVECWGAMAGPTLADMEQWWNDVFSFLDYSLEDLVKAYRALNPQTVA